MYDHRDRCVKSHTYLCSTGYKEIPDWKQTSPGRLFPDLEPQHCSPLGQELQMHAQEEGASLPIK